jgi:NIMA (never in mitosis gene a)-related kinase
VRLLQRLHHEYIVTYQDSFLERRTAELCIVMQLCRGGDLHAELGRTRAAGRRVSEPTAARWLTQLTLALQHVHAHGIIHRDLKTQNIFLTARLDLKLGDFGVSRVLERPTDLAATTVGTPFYMAPEIFRKLPYSAKADVWALGCVLYEVRLAAARPGERLGS